MSIFITVRIASSRPKNSGTGTVTPTNKKWMSISTRIYHNYLNPTSGKITSMGAICVYSDRNVCWYFKMPISMEERKTVTTWNTLVHLRRPVPKGLKYHSQTRLSAPLLGYYLHLERLHYPFFHLA